MSDAAPLLEVEDIETCYGLSQVLFGMSLSVRTGEMVALLGRNGMGKTTTIRSIMGLTPARAGAIRFAGHEVRQLALVPDRAARHRPRPRGAPDLSQSDRARKSRRRLRQSSRQPRSLDAGKNPRAVPAAGRARRQYGRHAVRRRAADAGDRPRADDQSAAADPGRGHRGPRAADPRRNLELPVAAEGARASRCW